jgi:biopolymer transport protein TolR
MAEINVTPMCDVMIVLLVIFMVATPLLDRTPGLSLPDSRTASDLPKAPATVVVVRSSGLIELGDDFVASPGELRLTLLARLETAEGPARDVHVKADRGLRYAEVLAVLNACRAAGADRVALVASREPSL